MTRDDFRDDPAAVRRGVILVMLAALLLLAFTLAISPFSLFAPGDTGMQAVHLLAELFAVVISILVVIISWHSLEGQEDWMARILIFAFTIVAATDILHAMSYDGMPDFFSPSGPDKAIFFWLMGRTVEAAAMLAIAARIELPGSRRFWLLPGLVVVALVFWVGTFRVDAFPQTFIPGSGVTPFKTGYEYVLCAVNLAIGAVLWRQAVREDSARGYLLAGSCVVIGMGGYVFAHYQAPGDFANIFGHAFKVIAYGMVYQAAFVFAIARPHRLLRESEQRLRESQEQLRTVSDNLPQGIVYRLLMHADGRRQYLYVSQGVERLFGVPADSVMQDAGLMYAPIVEEDADRVRIAEEESLRNLTLFDAVARIRRTNGEVRWIHACSQPRRLDDGRTIWDGVAIDVTDRERIAEALRRLNAELENRVAERTEALTAANRQLEAFSHMVAHDLRTPLRHISGFGSLLQEGHAGGLDASGRELLDRIIAASRTLSAQIDAMLAISRLRNAPLDCVETDLSEMADAVAAQLAADGGRQVQVSIQPGLVGVVDRSLMQNVLENLIGNAWKFTSGREAAHIRFGARDTDGEKVFYVRDNGAGFDGAKAGTLFGLFRRLHTESEFPGTGIGLASVRTIIENHGGRVWAEGQPGQGATFYFTLPQ